MEIVAKLKHKETVYTIVDDSYTDFNHAEFMWTDGNYNCDCNRSLYIGRQCDKSFPEMTCGEQIELVSLEEKQPH